jgi:hypothetical protein
MLMQNSLQQIIYLFIDEFCILTRCFGRTLSEYSLRLLMGCIDGNPWCRITISAKIIN